MKLARPNLLLWIFARVVVVAFQAYTYYSQDGACAVRKATPFLAGLSVWAGMGNNLGGHQCSRRVRVGPTIGCHNTKFPSSMVILNLYQMDSRSYPARYSGGTLLQSLQCHHFLHLCSVDNQQAQISNCQSLI